MPKSVTFIMSTLDDNKILMKENPGYKANLLALTEVERERLLRGNWKIKAAAGLMFRRTKVNMLEELPTDVIKWARGWDLAATSEDERATRHIQPVFLLAREGTDVISLPMLSIKDLARQMSGR